MCDLGNELINQIYEARRGEMGWKKPQPGDPRYSTLPSTPAHALPLGSLLLTTLRKVYKMSLAAEECVKVWVLLI